MSGVSEPFFSKLIKKNKVSADAYSFYFEKPRDFSFLAGQYLKMTLDIENPDERGNSRFFTIAASPTEQDLMITTRIIESTFKKTLNELPIGATVQIRAPFGQFVLDQEDLRPKVFLTGGIGITPFRSMLVYAAAEKMEFKITLIASFSSKEEFLFFDDLKNISNTNLKAIFTITHPTGNWLGQTGRIDAEMIEKYIAKPDDNVYYIAGPEALVGVMEELLSNLGIENNKIRTEEFPGYP